MFNALGFVKRVVWQGSPITSSYQVGLEVLFTLVYFWTLASWHISMLKHSKASKSQAKNNLILKMFQCKINVSIVKSVDNILIKPTVRDPPSGSIYLSESLVSAILFIRVG